MCWPILLLYVIIKHCKNDGWIGFTLNYFIVAAVYIQYTVTDSNCQTISRWECRGGWKVNMGDALGHFGHPLSSSLKSSTECNSVQKGRLIFKKSIYIGLYYIIQVLVVVTWMYNSIIKSCSSIIFHFCVLFLYQVFNRMHFHRFLFHVLSLVKYCILLNYQFNLVQ